MSVWGFVGSSGSLGALRLRKSFSKAHTSLRKQWLAPRRLASFRSSPKQTPVFRLNFFIPSATAAIPRKGVQVEERAAGRTEGVLGGLSRLTGPFWGGKSRAVAWGWTLLTLLLAVASSAFVIVSSVLQKRFFNILQEKNQQAFAKYMIIYGCMVLLRPLLLESYAWCKARISLRWRDELTNKFLTDYFTRMNYFRLTMGKVDNPDQRIAEDIKSFTKQAISLLCQCFTAFLEFAIFSVLLYRIHRPLLPTILVYTLIGTTATLLAGRKLISLRKEQLTREADYRFGLVRCRESAESIAFYGGEKGESGALRNRFGDVFDNKLHLTRVRRDVGFLTTGHGSVVQILPCLVVAKPFFEGKIKFGHIYQTFFAFNHVLMSVGLVVRQWLAISELTASLSRLSELDSCCQEEDVSQSEGSKITRLLQSDGAIRISHLSISVPGDGTRLLVHNLSLEIRKGERLLVVGQSGIGKSSLMRCIAGLWTSGSGRIELPPEEETLFLPQRPYLTLGTLRENIAYPSTAAHVSDEEARRVLQRVNLPLLIERVGGLDLKIERLHAILSPGEQQRLAFARVIINRPSTVVLDESTSALDSENEDAMYKIVQEMKITCISVGNKPSITKYHNRLLRLSPDGLWVVEPVSKAAGVI